MVESDSIVAVRGYCVIGQDVVAGSAEVDSIPVARNNVACQTVVVAAVVESDSIAAVRADCVTGQGVVLAAVQQVDSIAVVQGSVACQGVVARRGEADSQGAV